MRPLRVLCLLLAMPSAASAQGSQDAARRDASAQNAVAQGPVAQGPVARVTVERGDARARDVWAQRVDSALEAVELEAFVREAEPAGTVVEARLEVVSAIENHVAYARSAASHLEERAALLELAAAEDLARAHLDVPGMVAWYAEVELAIAMVAAQAGQDALSETALRRAVTLDPSRELLAAEARPELVERARAAIRASAVGPRGRFEVRTDAAGARIWLDDQPRGALPRALETSVGTHVLRVDAPGHHAWARTIEVYEGERAPLVVSLSPSPALAAARDARAAARQGDSAALSSSLAALPGATVWMLEVADRPDRALAQGCRADGCTAPLRLSEGELVALDFTAADGAAADGALADARGFLAPARGGPVGGGHVEPEWWQRWWVWTAIGVGALLVGGAIALGVALDQPRGAGPLIVTIFPDALR